MDIEERLGRVQRRAELMERLQHSPNNTRRAADSTGDLPEAPAQDQPMIPTQEAPASPPVGVTSPAPQIGVLHEILAALNSVLEAHPGLTVGIWQPGQAAVDVASATLIGVDPADHTVRVRLPTAPTNGTTGKTAPTSKRMSGHIDESAVELPRARRAPAPPTPEDGPLASAEVPQASAEGELNPNVAIELASLLRHSNDPTEP